MGVGEGLAAAGGRAPVGASGSDADGGPADTGAAAPMARLEDGSEEGVCRDGGWASTEAGNTEDVMRVRKNAEDSIVICMGALTVNSYRQGRLFTSNAGVSNDRRSARKLCSQM